LNIAQETVHYALQRNICQMDAIYRAHLRGASTRVRGRLEELTSEIARGYAPPEVGKERLIQTRYDVVRQWQEIGRILSKQGEYALAASAADFVAKMPPIRTERELPLQSALEHARLTTIKAPLTANVQPPAAR
jgi:hypothetical protein